MSHLIKNKHQSQTIRRQWWWWAKWDENDYVQMWWKCDVGWYANITNMKTCIYKTHAYHFFCFVTNFLIYKSQLKAFRNIHKNIHCKLWPYGSKYQIWGSLHDTQYPHLHAGPFHLARWYLKFSTVTDVFMWDGKEFHRRAPRYLIVWIPYLSV